MEEGAGAFQVDLELADGFEFAVDFGIEGVPSLRMDEPEPMGAGKGPNASRVLAAAVGNCLSASALFCLRKARIPVTGMWTRVEGRLARNEDGRLRVTGLEVTLHPEVAPEDRGRMRRCLEVFEDFCVVTQAVRAGLDVGVEVEPDDAPAPPGSG